jgi:addiction module RelB/DinJ family antitoxin
MATTLLRTRVDRDRTKEATKILGRLGLKPSDAVNMLMAQIVYRRGLPFDVQESGYAYAQSEYGLTPAEMDAAEKRIRQRIAKEKKAGTIREFRGDWQSLKS